MRFNCPQCQKVLTVPDNAAGRTGTCPKCHNKVRVPNNSGATRRVTPVSPSPRPSPATVPCPFCAEMISPQAVKCRFCGEFLNGPSGDYGPARPARRSRGASLPPPPNLPAQKSGFGQFVKMGCFFVAFMFVVLTIIGALTGRQDRGRESPMQSSTSRSEHWVDSLDEYGDWETPMELEDSDPESRAEGHFAIAQLLSRGTSLGGDLVMLEDGRIFNRNTYKVKCPK